MTVLATVALLAFAVAVVAGFIHWLETLIAESAAEAACDRDPDGEVTHPLAHRIPRLSSRAEHRDRRRESIPR